MSALASKRTHWFLFRHIYVFSCHHHFHCIGHTMRINLNTIETIEPPAAAAATGPSTTVAQIRYKRLFDRIQHRSKALTKMARFRKMVHQKVRKTKAVRWRCILNNIDRFIERHTIILRKLQKELNELKDVAPVVVVVNQRINNIGGRLNRMQSQQNVGACAVATASSSSIGQSTSASNIMAIYCQQKSRRKVTRNQRKSATSTSPLAENNGLCPELGSVIRMNSFYIK